MYLLSFTLSIFHSWLSSGRTARVRGLFQPAEELFTTAPYYDQVAFVLPLFCIFADHASMRIKLTSHDARLTK